MSEKGENSSPDVWQIIQSSVSGPTDTGAGVAKKSLSEKEKDGHQRRTLRYLICGSVVALLALELVGLYFIIVWQGRGHFQLGEWTFGFMTNGVILQTFFSFRTIVTHLFPDGAQDFEK